jgi:Ran GTPase-activating protein (RanGAP) involved in mRNA processing and transport
MAMPVSFALLALVAISALGNASDVDNVCPSDGSGGPSCQNATAELNSLKEIPPERLALVFGMLSFLVAWLLALLKCAIDGSLPARMALWGLLPEAFAAISPRALAALLRLKTHAPTPVILLQNSVTDANAETLAAAIRDYGKQAGLQAVELPNNPNLTAKGLRCIVEACLGDGQNIEAIDLSYNPQFGDEVVSVLQPFLSTKSPLLVDLKLADCNLTPGGLEKLLAMTEQSKIRLVDFSCVSLHGQDSLIEKIFEIPMLEEVTLSFCSMDAKDMQVLAEQLPATGVKLLHIGGNGFGSAGLVELSKSLPESLIDELGLEGNKIEVGCEGLKKLAEAWVKRPFPRIRLNDNLMSQEDIQQFVKTLRLMT